MFAPGIPDKNYFGTIPTARETQWDLTIQLHEADRAGRHYDIRLSPPGVTEAYSWACKEIPGPGAKTTAVEQPTHTREYMSFSGKIEKGYGAGKVSLYYSGKVIILAASSTEIKFVLEKNSSPERFLLKKGLNKEWLFYNYTPTINSKIYADLPSKPTKIKDVSDFSKHQIRNTEAWSPNLAGTENLIVLRDGKRPDIFSWAGSRRSQKKIDNSFKVNLGPMPTFTDHGKTILRGKLFIPGMEGNRAKRIANSSTANSRAPFNFFQGPNGQQIALFDVYKFKGQRVDHLPYEDKFKILESISRTYPGLKTIPLAKSPQEKVELLESISQGRNALTTRGIISYNLKEPKPFKFKIKDMSKEELVKTAIVDLAGAAMGFARADQLNNKEREKLREHYYMSPYSMLTPRNTARGYLGGGAGGIGGALLGSVGGALIGATSGRAEAVETLATLGGMAGFFGGGLGGAYLATNKYSKNNPILKEANAIIGGVQGAFRTSRLTQEEKEKIKEHHGMDGNANLTLRNTGRGAGASYLAATVAGQIGTRLAGGVKALTPEEAQTVFNNLGPNASPVDASRAAAKATFAKNKKVMLLSTALALPAGIAAAHFATNKYSKNSEALKKTAGANELARALIIGGGAATGGYRASKLSEEEKRTIKQKAGLKENANLSLRNSGRGIVGATAGSIGGGLLGIGAGVLASKAVGITGGRAIAAAGAIGGTILGAKKMTDKYSKKSDFLK